MTEWISVEDELPEDGRYVIVCGYDWTTRDIDIMKFTQTTDRLNNKRSGYFDRDYDYGLDVTHWMPLPEPPTQK